MSCPRFSDSPEAIKAIFSRSSRATAGSSCCENRKKAFITRAKAKKLETGTRKKSIFYFTVNSKLKWYNFVL
jgi:hypothetical protein